MDETTLIGREKEIAAFEKLLRHDADRRVMLVDGLSGTGKSWLALWLKQHRCQNNPAVICELTPGSTQRDILKTIVTGLLPTALSDYIKASDEIMAAVDTPIQINQQVSAKWGAVVSNVHQHVNFDYDAAKAAQDAKSITRHLDLVTSILAPMASDVFVVMIDEFEHVVDDALDEFLTSQLTPRLRQIFPGFRLYVTGQSVPVKRFARHEHDYHTLLVFSRDTCIQLLDKAGMSDSEIHTVAYDVTRGHPLMIGMLLDEFELRPGAFDKSSFQEINALIDERDRTRWIYDRVISRFDDPALRDMAAYLALFEWFDLNLLRSAFETELHEDAFNQMVERGFIKKLGRGRWVCHDVIRKHLESHRTEHDRNRARKIYEGALTAYTMQLDTEVERTGELFFDGRLEYVSAALHSVLELAPVRARQYLLDEVASSFAEADNDYIYALARMLERHELPRDLANVGQNARALLKTLNLYMPTDDAVRLLETLGEHAAESENVLVALQLLRVLVRLLWMMAKDKKAVKISSFITTLSDDSEYQLLLAESLSRSGQHEEALGVLTKLRENGEQSAAVGFTEARLYQIAGDQEQAKRTLTELVALVPNDTRARLSLGRMLFLDGQAEASLKHLERIKKDSPNYNEAQILRCDVLGALGRFSELSTCAADLAAESFSEILETVHSSMSLLSDPRIRGRILAELDTEKPDPSSFALTVLLGQVYSQEGNLDALRNLYDKAVIAWPEVNDVFEVQLGSALASLQRWQDAVDALNPLVHRGVQNMDAYVVLAKAHRKLGRNDLALDLLTEVADRFPAVAELALVQIADIKESDEPGCGLAYLDHLSKEDDLNGPYLLRMKAMLLAKSGKFEEAIDVMQRLVHTFDRSELPMPAQIENRTILATLLGGQDRVIEAAQLADELMEYMGDDHQAILAACNIYKAIGQESSVRQALKRVSPGSVRTRYAVTQMLIQLIVARGQSVEELLTELKAYPDRLETVGAIFIILAQQPEKVQSIVPRIAQAAPGALEEFNQLNMDRFKGAPQTEYEQLRRAAEENPANMDLRVALAFSMAGRGESEAAVNELQAMKELAPQFEEFADSLSVQLCVDSGDIDRAKSIVAPLLDRESPPSSLVMINTITAYYGACDDAEAAIAFHERVLKTHPQFRENSLQVITQILISQGRHEAALKKLEEVDVPGTEDIVVERLKVEALMGQEKYDDALAVLDEVLKLPHLAKRLRADLLDLRGDILRAANRPEAARAAYNDAIERVPQNARAHLGLAIIERDAQNWSDAYREMLDAITLNPRLEASFGDDLREIQAKARAFA